LRRAQSNAAIGGIWRVKGSAGPAVLKLAAPPAPQTADAAAACGAAKYSWLGPARVGSAARDDLERASYARDTDAVSRLQRLTDLVALISGWAASVPA
jgi:hypothetical protein